MTNQRFQQLIQYKAALDSEWKRKNQVGIQYDDYDKTLQQAKLDGFKVFRNAAGEHKLIDKLKDGETSFSELFGNIFGGCFR